MHTYIHIYVGMCECAYMQSSQVTQENISPETTKPAGHAQKQLGAMYRLKILVQRQGGHNS